MLNVRFSVTGVLALCLCLLLGWGKAQAHPLSDSLADPVGHAHAEKLAEALTAAQNDVTDEAFRTLFQENPNLNKRAFVALIDMMLDVVQADEAAGQAKATQAVLLAQLIEQQYGDKVPTQIVADLSGDIEKAAQGLIVYIDSLRPALVEGMYGADTAKASDYPPEGFAILKPFLVKLMRLQYAIAVASPELTISELDTYDEVETAFEKALVAAGTKPDEAEMDQTLDMERVIKLKRLTVLAEIGLLDEFEKGVRELLKGETDPLTAAPVLLTGFRAAYRQGRVDLAQEYIEEARTWFSKPDTASDPVLEYAMRTAEYQLRRLKGYRPTETQALDEATKAWSALADYQPLTFVRHEANWFYGRTATRYWMDELSQYPNAATTHGLVILKQIVAWVEQAENSQGLNSPLEGDDQLMHPDEIFGLASLLVAVLDQMTYVFENVPVIMEGADTVSTVQDLDPLTDILVEIQADLGLTQEGPGFPPYDIRLGGMVPELKARTQYLLAIAKGTAREKKPGQLMEAMKMARQTKNPEVTVDYLIKGGRRLAELGQHDQAVVAWKEALAIADELSFVQRSLDASSLLAQEYGRRKDWVNASLYADRASDKIQASAPMLDVHSEEGQAMAQTSQELTAISVKAAAAADNPEKALAALTRSQQVESATIQMEGQKEAKAEAREVFKKEEQVVALSAEVKRLEAMPSSETRNNLLESTQGLLADTRARFLAESRELRQKYSELYTKVLRFDPLNLPEIQKTLPSDLAVVQYFPTDDGLYIFLVTQKDFRLRKVATTTKALDASTQAYVRAIRRPLAKDAVLKTEGTKLYDALIAPVKADLVNCKTLVLIPSGRLNSLPFASLSDASGVPLGQTIGILELAKSTDLMRISAETPQPITSLVAFANATGDLPAAGKEGDEIAALFPEHKLFKEKQATRDAFVEFGGQADALHLATHGEWNIEDSLGNYLAMANNEKVSQDQIFELGLDETSIVILSACNTAMGDSGEVRYVASLAEAFWIAGSRSVVASLWAVDDESTSLLMTELYKSLRAGDGKAVALQKAQMAVRSKKEFEHPYYWAGFILFGDWR